MLNLVEIGVTVLAAKAFYFIILVWKHEYGLIAVQRQSQNTHYPSLKIMVSSQDYLGSATSSTSFT